MRCVSIKYFNYFCLAYQNMLQGVFCIFALLCIICMNVDFNGSSKMKHPVDLSPHLELLLTAQMKCLAS